MVPGSLAGLRVLSIFLEFGLVWRRELVGVLSLIVLSLCWALETCGGPFPGGGRAFPRRQQGLWSRGRL